jgi:hypothetical protein
MSTVREISERFVDDHAKVNPDYMSIMGVARSAITFTDYSPDGLDSIAEHPPTTAGSSRDARTW